MENKPFEASGNLSTLHTWNKSFFIFAVLFASAMSFPFRYPSFGFTFTFTNFLYANCRHYMFLFCNGIILLFIFLEYGSKHISKAAYSQENRALGPEVIQIECNLISFGSGLVVEEEEEETELTRDRIEDMETELVIHVCSEHENETNVKQIVFADHEYHIEDDQETEVTHDQTEDMEAEQVIHVCSEHENDETNVKQIVVDGHEHRIEDDHETEVALHVDSEHEIQAEVVVEEEEHDDQEEVHEFQQKCEAFIKKVKQSMHHEGPSYPPMIDSHNYADE